MEKLNQILIYVLSKQKTVERNWELNVIRIIIAFFNFKKVETKVKVKKARSHYLNSKSSTQSKIPEENYGESEPNFMQLLLSLFFLSKNCWKDWELNVIRIIKTFFNFKKVETKVKVKNDKLLFELEVINTIKNPRRKLWRNWTKF